MAVRKLLLSQSGEPSPPRLQKDYRGPVGTIPKYCCGCCRSAGGGGSPFERYIHKI